MDIGDIRNRNLLILIDELGGRPAFCKATGMDDGHLSVVLARKPTPSGKPRALGTNMARKIEAKLRKPGGWLDVEHDPIAEGLGRGLVRRTYMLRAMDPEIKQGDEVVIDTSIPWEQAGVKVCAFDTRSGMQLGRSPHGERVLLYVISQDPPIDITDDSPTYLGCVVRAARTY